MRALLDTHALLWALSEPDRLSTTARSVVADRSVDLLVSAASAWEIATKARLGRLPHAEPVLDAYEAHLARLDAVELPITTRHALLAGNLRWTHRDPFDRMLAAQAVQDGLVLVSRDTVFDDLAGVDRRW